MLNKEQLLSMLTLQDNMNKKVNPDWINAGYGYLKAAMVETVEAIQHVGYKWWKAETPDLPQTQMEMIDIWHFALSDLIIKSHGNLDLAAELVVASITQESTSFEFDGKTYDFDKLSLSDNLDLMTGLCAFKHFNIPLFFHVTTQLEMTQEDIYKQYVGKNILNFFRQDHGYKEGTYIKIWEGKEDNEHLSAILSLIEPSTPNYSDVIYAELAKRYSSLS